jgi:hypothetical protein
MNRKAEEMMFRLLRAGYPCVLFSDSDEFIAPDPRRYPGGLKQYFEKFIGNTQFFHRRTSGMELAHISFGNGSFSFDKVKDAELLSDAELEHIRNTYGYIEPPMNWNKTILSQRRYWVAVGKYSKPLLTKIRIRYRYNHNIIIICIK